MRERRAATIDVLFSEGQRSGAIAEENIKSFLR